MSTAVKPLPVNDIDTNVDMVVTIEIGPNGLDRYLDLVGDRTGPRIKYLQGSLTLVSPTGKHERGGDLLDELVKMIGEELDIAYLATASTLYRRRDLDYGIESDKSYYLEHAALVREVVEEIDLNIYPPPDLMIEVVVTHGPKKALAICQALGVPEVWVSWPKKGTLEFLGLDAQGRYVPLEASRAFPFLKPADVLPWLASAGNEPDNRWRQRLREWVRVELAPRHAQRD
jgi:Uma2 family endonuclease